MHAWKANAPRFDIALFEVSMLRMQATPSVASGVASVIRGNRVDNVVFPLFGSPDQDVGNFLRIHSGCLRNTSLPPRSFRIITFQLL